MYKVMYIMIISHNYQCLP